MTVLIDTRTLSRGIRRTSRPADCLVSAASVGVDMAARCAAEGVGTEVPGPGRNQPGNHCRVAGGDGTAAERTGGRAGAGT
jgi:ribosomal protein L18